MAKKEEVKKTGLDVKAPKNSCDDPKCPFHGSISLRGKSFIGTVVKAKMQKSVVVQWERRRYVPKYERYEKRRTKVKAHNPPCINAQEGDRVRIHETRPISKTVHFTIIQNESDQS